MGILGKNLILSAVDLKSEDVPVPEWGGDVRVRSLTGAERDAFDTSLLGKDGKRNLGNIRARLLALTIVDENGDRVFSDDDADQLGAKSAGVLERLFEVAQRLNGMGAAAEEEIAKN